MAQYDIHNMEERLQEIDPRIVRIDFNHARERHEIIARDNHGAEYIAFTVPWGELDARVERELYRIRPERMNPFEEVRRAEERKQRAEDKKIHDMATDLVENIQSSFRHKPSRSIE